MSTWSDVQVLLVEDNPADARLLKEILIDAGQTNIHLTHVDRLEKALQRISESHFDVVLLDLSLPDGDGLGTLVRMHQRAPDAPIVVLTGLDDEALALQAVREGAQDYLVKGQVNHGLLLRAMRYATERKRAVENLQRREEYFRSLIENALDIICILDAQGAIRYGSPSLQRVMGYQINSLIGRNALDLVHPEDRWMILQTLRSEPQPPGVTRSLEFRVKDSSGAWRVLAAIGRNLLGMPEVDGIVLNLRDVTERRKYEAELQQLNEKLRAVIETSPLSILSLDLDGAVTSWNGAAEKAFGWAEEEVTSQQFPAIQNEDLGRFRQLLDRLHSGEPAGGFDFHLRRRDGTVLDATIWAAALRNEQNRVTGYVAAVADNTERKRLEEQFRQAQKMDAVGRLAGGIAHDFNNLLTVITGYCQMLLSGLSPQDPLSADMHEVLKAANRATDLTKQLLAFSRRQIVQPKVLDPNTLINDMHQMLRRLIGETISLSLNLTPSIDRVKADPGQLEQVLVNLVVNARDAMPSGGKLIVETSNVQLDETYARDHLTSKPGRYVMIAVSDTGHGIDPEIRANLFEPFFTTKEKGKGTGLGLSTSYGIIKQNGGDIWVYSEVGVGTTFKIYLPALPGKTAVTTEQAKPSSAPMGTETLLIVEDEDGVRAVLQEMLKRHGYKVLAAATSDEASALFEAHRNEIDLLITDVVMPGMSGRELADKLRLRSPELKVLFVSGYTDNAIVHHGVLAPGTAFLQKPFTTEAIAKRVRQMLEGRTEDAR